jgi:hypothetical protein
MPLAPLAKADHVTPTASPLDYKDHEYMNQQKRHSSKRPPDPAPADVEASSDEEGSDDDIENPLDTVYDLMLLLTEHGRRDVSLRQVLAASALPPETTYQALQKWIELKLAEKDNDTYRLIAPR